MICTYTDIVQIFSIWIPFYVIQSVCIEPLFFYGFPLFVFMFQGKQKRFERKPYISVRWKRKEKRLTEG